MYHGTTTEGTVGILRSRQFQLMYPDRPGIYGQAAKIYRVNEEWDREEATRVLRKVVVGSTKNRSGVIFEVTASVHIKSFRTSADNDGQDNETKYTKPGQASHFSGTRWCVHPEDAAIVAIVVQSDFLLPTSVSPPSPHNAAYRGVWA